MKKLFTIGAIIIAINGYSQNGTLNFDGTDDFVDVGNATALQLTGAVTYEAWVWTSSSTNGYIFGRRSSDASNGMANDLVMKNDGTIRFRAASGGSIIHKAEGTTPINDGQWHHVAGVFFPGDSVQVYVDGVLEDQITTSVINSINANSLPFQIGKPGGTATVTPFDGEIDEVRVWNTARTNAEINANMNSCLSGSEIGLVAYYNFEDGAGSSILSDLTLNANHGTLTNMDTVISWTSSSPLYCCAIDTSITANMDSLTSNASGATYQWLDCDNNMASISGETGQLFTPTVSGNYAVEITKGSCIDTSACKVVTITGISNANNNEGINIYPNPTNGIIIIDLENKTGSVNYIITAIDGRVVVSNTTFNNKITVDLTRESRGIYFLKVKENKMTKTFKVIKQ